MPVERSKSPLARKNKLKAGLMGYLFAGPFIVLSLVFLIYPMIKGIYNSFFDFRFGGMKFVGLANYTKIFTDDVYLLSIRNTLFFVFAVLPLLCVLGVWIAGSVFDKSKRYTSFVRVCLYLPVIASVVVMSIIWRFMLDSQNGLLRYVYNLLGMEPYNLLGNVGWTMAILVFILFTVNIGQCIILYLAAMIGIPKDLIEALEIDGGNRWHLFRYVLIPLTKPTTLLIFVTQTAAVIRVFVLIQLLTNGGPNRQSTTMMYLIYQEGFANGNFGPASALGMVLFLFSVVLVFIQFVAVRSPKD